MYRWYDDESLRRERVHAEKKVKQAWEALHELGFLKAADPFENQVLNHKLKECESKLATIQAEIDRRVRALNKS